MSWSIRFKQLDFGYGEGPLLFDQLNWQDPLAPSEVLAILGRSGSGKSTLLELIAGLKRPRRGSILLDEEDITSLKPASRRCAVVFQERSLFPGSVGFNLDFALRCRRVPAGERKKRTKDLLRLVGLEHYERQSVDALSGGERQRIELARALASQPRLLLLDEPLGQLDIPLKKDLVEQIRKWIKSEHVRAVYVTHDTNEAFTVADRISVLGHGGLTTPRPPTEIYLDPTTLAEAQLTGTVNLLRGSVDSVVGACAAIRMETSHLIEIQTSAALRPGDKLWLGFRPTCARPFNSFSSNPSAGLRFSGALREARLIDGLIVGDVYVNGSPGVKLQVASLPYENNVEDAVTELAVQFSDLLLFLEDGGRISIGSFSALETSDLKPG